MKYNILGIVSGKGGVGKTTVTVNLSAALMQLQKNVIAIDADVKMSGLGLQLGMYHFPVTLNDVLVGNRDVYEALYIHSTGLRLIPASLYAQAVNTTRLKDVLTSPFLNENMVFVDAPPGLEKNAIDVLRSCPGVLIVTTPDIPSIADAMKIVSVAERSETEPLGVIINMYKEGEKNQISIPEIESILHLPVIGTIPFDYEVKKSVFNKLPVVFYNPYSHASIAFKKIAAKLIEQEYVPEKGVLIKRFLRRFKQ